MVSAGGLFSYWPDSGDTTLPDLPWLVSCRLLAERAKRARSISELLKKLSVGNEVNLNGSVEFYLFVLINAEPFIMGAAIAKPSQIILEPSEM